MFGDKTIKTLETPIGFFSVFDGDGKIGFNITENRIDDAYWVYENKKHIGDIYTKDNYEIILYTSRLEVGKRYTVQFSEGEFEYCESDEKTKCFTYQKDGWMVGMGFFDPNETEKLSERDVSEFKGYLIGMLEKKNGFWFELIDNKYEQIKIPVAWLKTGEYDRASYNSAMGLWLT